MAGEFDAWVGRVDEAEAAVSPAEARRLAATLDLAPAEAEAASAPGAVLPPLWHWIAFLPVEPMAGLGPDGHPRRGAFLPPVPLERRMWAGGRLSFPGDLVIGAPIRRRSEILKVAEKTGSTGRMVFVTVGHRLSGPSGLAVEEEQDIVYLPMPDSFRLPPPVAAPSETAWNRRVSVDSVRLFRFSAVTFNAHRIHYDLPYAREVEKYPGLVVHGPLQAMLLLGAAVAEAGGRRPAGYRFRGVRPLFPEDGLRLVGEPPEGRGQRLATVTDAGQVAMQAEVTW